jgi:hypothetical protein
MKKVFFILILVPFFAFRCERQTGVHCYKGKVIRISCASYVIQVLSHDTIGQDQWKDSTTAGQAIYDNVFNVSNKCIIPDTYKPGDILYFDLENPGTSNCVVCMMYDAPPAVQFKVKNVSSTPCQ